MAKGLIEDRAELEELIPPTHLGDLTLVVLISMVVYRITASPPWGDSTS
jgi:hypothetical protein